MSKVVVVDYDAEWPRHFERIRSYVWPAVRDVALGFEHVGSTAVEGLRAKPVIDACVVVATKEDVPACIEGLAGVGYVHRGDLGAPEREAFRAPVGLPRHHLYVSPRGCLSLRNHLGLRDHLRSHPAAAREYGELKAALARRFPEDIDRYSAGKTEFVLDVLRRVGVGEDELDEIRRINRAGDDARNDGSERGQAVE